MQEKAPIFFLKNTHRHSNTLNMSGNDDGDKVKMCFLKYPKLILEQHFVQPTVYIYIDKGTTHPDGSTRQDITWVVHPLVHAGKADSTCP